ncbi:uncharacterized protein AB675_9818 [Cyphellophora attinorum]|uniref:Uncharacterized protein n=1 Tax=Cyphellophora attinorum TaxID=1664694 RepID=A0A0N1HTW4_9EURO|nr:uncharacterized protein AB675_9818 [Phialophora attinorum]KPI42627.1 hypothetical protein AB675_9818 [Phialophora attinorum]
MAQVLASSPAEQHSPSTSSKPTAGSAETSAQKQHVPNLAKLPGYIIVQVLENLLPEKIEAQIAHGTTSLLWHTKNTEPVRWDVNGYDVQPKLTLLLIICKDLSALLGPMIFSRMEVVVTWIGNTQSEVWPLMRERREDCARHKDFQTSYDRALSSVHRNLVEKYDDRVWVNGAARDRELGLFRAAPPAVEVDWDEWVAEAMAQELGYNYAHSGD